MIHFWQWILTILTLRNCHLNLVGNFERIKCIKNQHQYIEIRIKDLLGLLMICADK